MPCAFASPHTACSCASVIVCLPPSRMLADAKILMTSAPSFFSCRTFSRISSGVPLLSLNCRIDVRMRGPGEHAARDRLAQVDVVRLAGALDRREAGHQRDVRVLGAVERLLRRRPGARLVAAVGVEVPADVRVDVDHARHDRQSVRDRRWRWRRRRVSIAVIFDPCTTIVAIGEHFAGAVDDSGRVDAHARSGLRRHADAGDGDSGDR